MSIAAEKPSSIWATGGPSLFLMVLAAIPMWHQDATLAMECIVISIVVFAWRESMRQCRKDHHVCEDKLEKLENRFEDNERDQRENLQRELAHLRKEWELK